jgi:hypothetical protein
MQARFFVAVKYLCCRFLEFFAVLFTLTSASNAQLPPAPQVNAAVNSASFLRGGPLAPGVIFAVFGSSLTDGRTASASSVPLPTQSGGSNAPRQWRRSPSVFCIAPTREPLLEASSRAQTEGRLGKLPARTSSLVSFFKEICERRRLQLLRNVSYLASSRSKLICDGVLELLGLSSGGGAGTPR